MFSQAVLTAKEKKKFNFDVIDPNRKCNRKLAGPPRPVSQVQRPRRGSITFQALTESVPVSQQGFAGRREAILSRKHIRNTAGS